MTVVRQANRLMQAEIAEQPAVMERPLAPTSPRSTTSQP
jgi:hypothetical protein